MSKSHRSPTGSTTGSTGDLSRDSSSSTTGALGNAAVESLSDTVMEADGPSVLDLFETSLEGESLDAPAVERLDIDEKDIPEPSGMTFDPSRGSFFVVGDRGHLVEMTDTGEILNRKRVLKADIEGVTVGPEGTLYLAQEGPPRIHEVDPNSFEVLRTLKVDRKHDGEKVIEKKENAGLEGIVYVASLDAFYAVNQDKPPVIVRLAMPESGVEDAKAEIEAVFPLKDIVEDKASDITFDESSGNFLVTESCKDKGLLHVVTPEGEHVTTYELPGKRTEGFAMDDTGAAFLAQDSGAIKRMARD